MGLLKFILYVVVIYFLLRAISRLLANLGRKRTGQYSQQQREQQPRKGPETQEERILDYQKRNFENTDVHDVDFVEIKDSESDN